MVSNFSNLSFQFWWEVMCGTVAKVCGLCMEHVRLDFSHFPSHTALRRTRSQRSRTINAQQSWCIVICINDHWVQVLLERLFTLSDWISITFSESTGSFSYVSNSQSFIHLFEWGVTMAIDLESCTSLPFPLERRIGKNIVYLSLQRKLSMFFFEDRKALLDIQSFSFLCINQMITLE